ncbi:glycosyltransferase family 4 protein [Candidatus Peregrinibacteria bacterium]|nr:glycosyltransferase family 4 protein [Candidatus Peregrinibacteria bacterium]
MKVLIDLRALQSGNISGVEIYVRHITNILCTSFPNDQFFLWTNSESPLPPDFPEFSFPNSIRIHTSFSNRILLISSALFRRPYIDRLVQKEARKKEKISSSESFDVVFIPDPRPAPSSPKVAKVILVHDLSPLHFARTFSLKTRIWHKFLRLKKEMNESYRICTPSHFTKDDIQKCFHIPGEKITVIGAGVSEYLHPISDPIELDIVRKKYHLPHNFFLSLSTLEPRKNLANLVEAFLRFQRRCDVKNCALVIAGKENPRIFSKIHLQKSSSLIFSGFIDEEDKSVLYSAAKAFIMPSFFEGFGLPVLEAMACGTPILSSNASSLPEVYGDAALSFDPSSVTEISRAIETIYCNRNAQKELSQKALRRSHLENFSWKTVGRKLMHIFEEARSQQSVVRN